MVVTPIHPQAAARSLLHFNNRLCWSDYHIQDDGYIHFSFHDALTAEVVGVRQICVECQLCYATSTGGFVTVVNAHKQLHVTWKAEVKEWAVKSMTLIRATPTHAIYCVPPNGGDEQLCSYMLTDGESHHWMPFEFNNKSWFSIHGTYAVSLFQPRALMVFNVHTKSRVVHSLPFGCFRSPSISEDCLTVTTHNGTHAVTLDLD